MSERPPTEYQRLSRAREQGEQFIRWIERAQSGWCVQYHYGALAVDRTNPMVNITANVVAAAADAGLVILTQERGDDKNYHYYNMQRTGRAISAADSRKLYRQLRKPGDSPTTIIGSGQRSQHGRVLPPLPRNAAERVRRNDQEKAGRARELGERLLEELVTEDE